MPDPACSIVGCPNPGCVLMTAGAWPERVTYWLCRVHWAAQSQSVSVNPPSLTPITITHAQLPHGTDVAPTPHT